MKTRSILFSLLLLTGCGPLGHSRPEGTPAIATRGVVYTGYNKTSYSTSNNQAYLQEMQTLGANTVSVLVTCVAEDENSSVIDCTSDQTPETSGVTDLLTQAKAQGFSTDLRVYIDLKNGTWRGHWKPSNLTSGFSQLSSTLVTYATLAQSLQTDSFTIGAEYVSLTRSAYTVRWQELIQAVRAVYSGKMTYAANGGIDPITNGREYEQVGFWQNLDWIGFTHYEQIPPGEQSSAPLVNSRPSRDRLLEMERGASARFQAFAESKGMPYQLAETGFPAARGASYAPWDWTLPPPPDPIEMAWDYDALLEAFTSSPVTGVHLWQYVPEDTTGTSLAGTGFGLSGKPAFDIVKGWFQ